MVHQHGREGEYIILGEMLNYKPLLTRTTILGRLTGSTNRKLGADSMGTSTLLPPPHPNHRASLSTCSAVVGCGCG